jgi:hypothetical protein
MSLQDQLRKMGLVKDKQVRSAEKQKRVEQSRRRQAKLPVVDPLREIAEQQRAEQAARHREVNRQREERLRARAVAAEIRQLVDAHRVTRERGDIAFNFVVGKKVKRLYVTAAQRDELVAGRLRIVVSGQERGAADEQFDFVSAAIAERIAERDAQRVAAWKPATAADGADDAHYARFKVPDDLDW